MPNGISIPFQGDWNTAANWTPDEVPNGQADTATFGLSHTTDVSISAGTEVNGITFTAAATNPYTITANPGLTLTLSGTGITNNSGTTQNCVTAGHGIGHGEIVFTNSATAGSSTIFINNGGSTVDSYGITEFLGSSSAGSGTFINNASAVIGGGGGAMVFSGNSSAANATFINKGAAIFGTNVGENGVTLFFGNSTAANATFTNNGGTAVGAIGGIVEFSETSSAGNGNFINNGATAPFGSGGSTSFHSSTTAANATFTNNGGTVSNAGGGLTFFEGESAANATCINNAATVAGASGGATLIVGTAANATFTNNGASVSGAGAGFTRLSFATADHATFINNGGVVSGATGGFTRFIFDSTAASATLIANSGTSGGDGGTIFFEENSAGGTSRVELFGNGSLDISAHNAPGVTIGSIEGDGNVFLGAKNLSVGSNNLSTDFSGVIQDGGQNGGVSGSLTKIGSGTLILSGANTYSGNTNVHRGVLQVDGSINSNTSVHQTGTLAGTGTINGNVNNWAKVSPGEALGVPGMLTVIHDYTQAQYATLMIQIADLSAGQFSVLDVVGNANLNGFLDPVLLNGFVPSVGDQFTFLNYASFSGAFRFQDGGIFNHGTEHWVVTYQPTYATLTATTFVPDQGSTFVLLTLGLLALLVFQRQLLRKQW